MTEQNFWINVDKKNDDDCWEWTGKLLFKKYGQHRFSYQLHNPTENMKGLLVCHKCDNPKCVNPKHLFLGTQKDNMQDCKNKGRTTKGFKMSKETCEKIGLAHKNIPLTEEHKTKISSGLIEAFKNPVIKENLRKSLIGNTRTKGYKLSNEHKDAISKKMKNRIFSNETKLLMSQSAKLAWAKRKFI